MLTGNTLVLKPKASTSPGETHAAMIVSEQEFDDVQFSGDFTTMRQLREGSPPNNWESAWAIFNHTDDDHFYYVAFKPNGWELGKVDPRYGSYDPDTGVTIGDGGQRFLATGTLPDFDVGSEHRFNIRVNDNTITVRVDGEILTTFTDTERPYMSGSVGFYTEDARVAFDNIRGSITEEFERYPAGREYIDGDFFGPWHVDYTGFGTAKIVDFDV